MSGTTERGEFRGAKVGATHASPLQKHNIEQGISPFVTTPERHVDTVSYPSPMPMQGLIVIGCERSSSIINTMMPYNTVAFLFYSKADIKASLTT